MLPWPTGTLMSELFTLIVPHSIYFCFEFVILVFYNIFIINIL